VPFSALDEQTALIVIDLQQGVVTIPPAHSVDDVIKNSTALVTAFRRHGLPVVLVKVAGTPSGRTDNSAVNTRTFPDGWTELIPELDRQPDDIVVTKHARSAFSDTGLTERLRGLGVTQVVVVGISTSGGVESTARHAHEHNFNVTLPVDAMTDRTEAAHEHSVGQVFPRIAETGTTEQLIQLLDSTRSSV
jgi:nicotinamidase-related amidase